MTKTTPDDFEKSVVLAKSAARKRYEELISKVEAAYRSGLFDAAKRYEEELAGIDKMRDSVLEHVFGEGGGSAAGSARVRPPTWKDAVLAALTDGPREGLHVSAIWEAIQAMGVRAKGAKTASDPLLMVDDALHRLGPKVRRVGRRIWAISPQESPGNEKMVGTL